MQGRIDWYAGIKISHFFLSPPFFFDEKYISNDWKKNSTVVTNYTITKMLNCKNEWINEWMNKREEGKEKREINREREREKKRERKWKHFRFCITWSFLTDFGGIQSSQFWSVKIRYSSLRSPFAALECILGSQSETQICEEGKSLRKELFFFLCTSLINWHTYLLFIPHPSASSFSLQWTCLMHLVKTLSLCILSHCLCVFLVSLQLTSSFLFL